MKTAIIHGCYNTTNFGDLLLLEIISKYIKEKHNIKPKSIRLHPKMELDFCEQQTSIKDSLKPDFAIFGGGGYLHDHGQDGAKKTLRYYLPARVWKLLGVPYIVLAPGGGPTCETKAGFKRLKYVLSKASHIALRDEITTNFARYLGVDRKDLITTADLALTIKESDIPKNRKFDLLGLVGSENLSKKKIGFHLELIYSDKSKFNEFCELPFFQDPSVLEKYHFVFFYDYKTDNEQWVRERLAKIEGLSFSIQTRMNHWVTVDFLRQLDAIITSKLHVSIVGTAFNVPIFGYSFHEKTKRYFEEIGRKNFQSMMDEEISVVNKWIYMLHNEDLSAWNHNQDLVERIKGLAKNNLELLDSYIKATN